MVARPRGPSFWRPRRAPPASASRRGLS